MAARHIEIAREDGPKAGFRAWVEMMERSGLPQVKQQLKEVRSQGNKKAQFEYYCAKFGKQFAQGTASAARAEVEDDELATLRQQFAELQARIEARTSGEQVEEEDTSLDDVDEDEVLASVGTGRTSTRSTTQVHKGKPQQVKNPGKRAANAPADPRDYAPRDPDMNSTSGRLWLLNEAGLLSINTRPGDPISCGEAHNTIQRYGLGNGGGNGGNGQRGRRSGR